MKTPSVELSIVICLIPCGQFISSIFVRNVTPILAFSYNAPHSASEASSIIFFIIIDDTTTAPFGWTV